MEDSNDLERISKQDMTSLIRENKANTLIPGTLVYYNNTFYDANEIGNWQQRPHTGTHAPMWKQLLQHQQYNNQNEETK